MSFVCGAALPRDQMFRHPSPDISLLCFESCMVAESMLVFGFKFSDDIKYN